MANRIAQQINSSYRSRHPKRTIPEQPDGEPRGKHRTGFKGAKVEGVCNCGRCYPEKLRKARGDAV